MLAFVLAVLGSQSPEPPVAPPPRLAERSALPPGVDPALADWTPRPATGKAEPWEKATDKDWVDARFREMNTGPALNCTLDYPLEKGKPRIFKATAIRLGDGGGAVFDRCTLWLSAEWSKSYLNHSERRFGLLNTPTPAGPLELANSPGVRWRWANSAPPAKPPFTAVPNPALRYRGHYLHGNRVVLAYTIDGRDVFESHRAERGTVLKTIRVAPGPNRIALAVRPDHLEGGGLLTDVFDAAGKTILIDRGQCVLGTPDDLDTLTKPGPKRWGEPLVTQLVRGDGTGSFAIDTLTIPYDNPHKALFFCTGLDFLPDGRIAVCTCHGDVWLVTVNEVAGTCSWQRFATGLYHPLGLKVVDGKVVVLERGQLTRLHDGNDDGEADYYECLANDWHTGGGEHSYDTCLETDPEGNFYFFKTGDTNTPTGGCLMKASKDGRSVEIFATGFRHPIGMGMSPNGILTGADQEGNWMPATRIDEYRRGGFYGDMRAHHRPVPPKTFDPPLCWLPREVDNSAGGQVWVPPNAFGPLAGLPLHFSYGRCRPHVLLRQVLSDGRVQGGVAALDVTFLSGVCRGRFGRDGHLYTCGLNGWQTAAKADGCLQRMRYTGQPLDIPVKLVVSGNIAKLTFSRALDPKSAANAANYRAARWNYRWSGDYGSDRWKVSDPNAKGQDEFTPTSARLIDDGRTIELSFASLVPVMQMQIGYNVLAADGRKVVGSVFHTIHDTRE